MVAAAVAALVWAGSAQAGGFYEAKVLEPAASFVAGKPVKVLCASTPDAWAAFVESVGGGRESNGWAIVGGSEIRLSGQMCPVLRGALRHEPQYVPALAATIQGLTHEAIHNRGERDEGVTECDSMHETPAVATRFFFVKPGKQLRALMAAAWVYHREEPPQYLTRC